MQKWGEWIKRYYYYYYYYYSYTNRYIVDDLSPSFATVSIIPNILTTIQAIALISDFAFLIVPVAPAVFSYDSPDHLNRILNNPDNWDDPDIFFYMETILW